MAHIKNTTIKQMAFEIFCDAVREKLLNGAPIGWDIDYAAGEIRFLYYRDYIETQYRALRLGNTDAATITRKIHANLIERSRFDKRAARVAETLKKVLYQ